MKQGRWQDAYPLLVEAWKNKRHWQIALNLGRTELEVGKYRSAVEHLTFVEVSAEASADAQREAVNLKLQAKAKLGHLRIDASPPGARVFVDGQIVDRVPVAAPVAVDPGAHDVELRIGGQRKAQRVHVESGKVADVTLLLRLLAPDPTTVVQTSAPPPSPAPRPTQAPEKRSSTRTWLLVSGSTLALTGLVLGGVSVGVVVDENHLAARAGDPAGQHSVNAVTYTNVALWSFGSAAAVGGATLVYYLISAPPKTAITASPFAGHEGGGVLLRGNF